METPVSDPETPPAEPSADAKSPDAEGESISEGATGDSAASRAKPAVTVRFSGRQIFEWAGLLGGALIIALLIRTFLFQPFYIPTSSMYPTLKVDDRVLVNKLSYKLHDVHRGDIIVFTAPEGEGADGVKDLIKRVVGLPGESLEGHDGHVYVDGRVLEETYLPDGVVTGEFGPQEVPAGSYWMMGDNRTQSRDSRYFGPIPESDIVGRAFVRLWPVSRLDFL